MAEADQKSSEIDDIVNEYKNSPLIRRMQRLCQTIVVNSSGYPLQSDCDIKQSTFIASHALILKEAANSAVRAIDPTDELTFLRVQTMKNELIIGHEKEFSIIAVRDLINKWQIF